ncbi:unnamed protein product, partial [Ectocarpus sp. 8 AP-2014]
PSPSSNPLDTKGKAARWVPLPWLANKKPPQPRAHSAHDLFPYCPLVIGLAPWIGSLLQHPIPRDRNHGKSNGFLLSPSNPHPSPDLIAPCTTGTRQGEQIRDV